MEVTRIYMNKIFMRLKNKTQLFSAQADDHYHTRLIHSLEVASISLIIADKLKNKYKLDLIALHKGALLHDIGHTPFGHAGERTLHNILSGKDDCYGYVDVIKKYDIKQGFKHNINSGLLYKESTKYFDIEPKVMDAIVKHTKICYTPKNNKNNNKMDNLDYGLEYVTSGIPELKENYRNHKPKYLEGYIVSMADEIAQICSDYLDLINFGDFKKEVKATKLYKSIHGINKLNYRKQAEEYCKKLIDLFSGDILRTKNGYILGEDSKFILTINEFNNVKDSCINKNTRIKLFDASKETIIRTLYAYYFTYPLEMEKGVFDSICVALGKIKGFSSEQYDEIRNLSKKRNKKEETIKFINNCRDNICNTNLSKNDIKRNKKVLKTFLRYIAVYISKMTDNFASEKYKKIVCAKFI